MIEATVKRQNPEEEKAFPFGFVLGLTLLVALASRLPYFYEVVVPLNDGGMFAQIVDDIRENGLRLPAHTTYNGLNLPMSYPPLAFMLAAILATVGGFSSVSLLMWMPLAFNLASVVAFVELARRMTSSRLAWVCSCFLFAILPQSAGWLVMGGGLTRSLGFFFSLLCFLAAHQALTRYRRRAVIGVGLFAALAGLSHLESGTLVVLVLPLFTLALGGKPWENIRKLLPAVAVAAVICLPWLAWLEGNVGFDPLRFASHTSGGKPFLEGLAEVAFGLFFTDKFVGLCVLVAPTTVFELRHRRWLLPAWCGVAMILVSRSAYTQVSVPAAMLAGEGFAALLRLRAKASRPIREFGVWATICVALAAWSVAAKFAYGYPLPAKKWEILAAVSPDELNAMRWCRDHTPAKASFVVISERMDLWYMDMVGEWFPYFSQRHAVLTVQGREWRPNDEFRHWRQLLETASEMPRLGQLDAVVDNTGEKYDYAFVAGPFYEPRATLAREIANSHDFRLVHECGNVRIYQRS